MQAGLWHDDEASHHADLVEGVSQSVVRQIDPLILLLRLVAVLQGLEYADHLKADAVDGDVVTDHALALREQLVAHALPDERHLALLVLVETIDRAPGENPHRIDVFDIGETALNAEGAVLHSVHRVRRAAAPDANRVLRLDHPHARDIRRDSIDVAGTQEDLAADRHALVGNLCRPLSP